MTYEETMDAFNEALMLGYSVKQAMEELEYSEDVNEKAMEELKHLQKYGI